MPKLSIITVNLNNKAGLIDTAESIVTQTSADYEWIIIDGGSTDGSIDIIKEYEGYTKYWVSESDTGVYNAMNKGIREAKGEYCLFLNSGDCLISNETLVNVFKEIGDNVSDIFFCDCINSDKTVIRYPRNFTVNHLVYESLNHQNSLIKCSLFIEHGLYNENLKICSDWEFFLMELWKYKSTFCHIETNISVYNVDGISSKSSMAFENTIVIKNVFEELADTIIEYQKLRASIYYGIIENYGKSKLFILWLKIYREVSRIISPKKYRMVKRREVL